MTIDYDTNPEVDEDRIKELIQGALTDSKFNAEIAQKIIKKELQQDPNAILDNI